MALMLAQLIAGIGSQHYYPRESTAAMWFAVFLAARVYLEEQKQKLLFDGWHLPVTQLHRLAVFLHERLAYPN